MKKKIVNLLLEILVVITGFWSALWMIALAPTQGCIYENGGNICVSAPFYAGEIAAFSAFFLSALAFYIVNWRKIKEMFCDLPNPLAQVKLRD